MSYFKLFFFLFLFQIGFSQQNIFDISRKGSVEEVKEAMKQNPDIINSLNDEGYSPLILASYRGNVSVVNFLIQNVKDINGSGPMGTPLMAAVVKGNKEIVLALLENNADANLSDANGTTALIYAVQFKNVDIIKLLLSYKADKSKIDDKGKTAFEYAVFSNNDEIINLFK
ncbi:ankyrin repeat domain-containing protein [Flavobacterium cellulosilyticum]|uniref:Ankyrin repeat domain-containing protein n=1 Tax=Flavobacterium cellulosilyticum TaxID=2541731 RepID=A0A4R5CGD2_9FLAO|nr:ankyrin repeat domain-containing protein [Flavobacterium cellulosilyticum]TDD97343.1 ankyrin repeat domain-containing protein [Flavobacterium cellulosilyticum]